MTVKLWLRAETKPNEHRSALTPSVCEHLIKKGYVINVERSTEKSTERFFSDAEYEKVGCQLVEPGSWKTAPKEFFIVGLKELPENDESPLEHRHIFFAHCFKHQRGWQDLIKRFHVGGGELYDLEFLNDDQGRRVAAFGYYAGFAGSAVGIDVWCHQQLGFLKMEASSFPPINPFKDEEALIAHIKAKFESVSAKNGGVKFPKVHVMGALGRCGSGAVDFARKAGIPEENIIKWDMAETAVGGPFPVILESDIFVNCIYLSKPIPPFLSVETLKQGGKLSVVVDVSCDTSNPHNPLPFCDKNTTFDSPTYRIHKGSGENDALDIITIDHLPTLLPRESSDRFSNDLLSTFEKLENIQNERVWQDALKLFRDKVKEAGF